MQKLFSRLQFKYCTFAGLRISKPPLQKRLFVLSNHKHQLKTMKIDSPQYHSLFTAELQVLMSIFEKYGYELRIAGGAVRDLLMGVTPHDLDFATNATPPQMREMFTAEQIRILNTNGEAHGTVTVRINDKVNYEVTTLRIDVLTDGRHARVEFTNDWRLDANRRDLTINALFIDVRDGTVYDYFNGVEDIQARRVRFVGEASSRICEDYLRILRYFRFFGRISERGDIDAHDSEALDAIAKHGHGLQRIAGERIWVELRRIVVQRFAPSVLRLMHSLGLFDHMGLPADPDLDEFERVYERAIVPTLSASGTLLSTSQSRSGSPCREESDTEAREQSPSRTATRVPRLEPLMPCTALAGLLRSKDDITRLTSRLRLSNEERGTAALLVLQRPVIYEMLAAGVSQEELVRFYQRVTVTREFETPARGKSSPPHKEGRITELCKYFGDAEVYSVMRGWRTPRFPVRGEALVTRGLKQSRIFGQVMQRLRERWIASHFTLNEEALLEMLPSILKEIEAQVKPNSDSTARNAGATPTDSKKQSPKRSKT